MNKPPRRWVIGSCGTTMEEILHEHIKLRLLQVSTLQRNIRSRRRAIGTHDELLSLRIGNLARNRASETRHTRMPLSALSNHHPNSTNTAHHWGAMPVVRIRNGISARRNSSRAFGGARGASGLVSGCPCGAGNESDHHLLGRDAHHPGVPSPVHGLRNISAKW
jgi:hypothetical protein